MEFEGFVQRLRIAMAAKNMTGVSLARHIGVSKAAIHKWTSGKAMPSSSKLVAMAKSLDVPLDFLFNPAPLDLWWITDFESAVAIAEDSARLTRDRE